MDVDTGINRDRCRNQDRHGEKGKGGRRNAKRKRIEEREQKGRGGGERCARNVTDVAWKLVREERHDALSATAASSSSSLGLIVADLIIPPCSKETTAARLCTCTTRLYTHALAHVSRARARACVYMCEQRVGRWKRVASPFVSPPPVSTPRSPRLTLLALMTDSAARCARAKAGTYLSWFSQGVVKDGGDWSLKYVVKI